MLGDAYDHGVSGAPLSTIDISCGGCLTAIRFETEPHEDAPVTSHVLAPGAVVVRFRDAVRGLLERGVIEDEIPALLGDLVLGVLVGVPEIANEILAKGARSVRIQKASYAMPAWYFTVWGAESPWRLDRFPEHIDDAQKKSALRDGEFGGFIVPEHGSRVLVLPLQKFQVVGFYNRQARLALPRFAEKKLGQGHPGFLIPWEQLVPDRARRPL